MQTAKPVTDKELRDAIEGADLPPRDFRLFHALLYRADWHTGVIPERFQDRSVETLAARCRMSKASADAALGHLERHGWITRERQPPGPWRPIRYALHIGKDCDCPKAAKTKRTDADRAREYRQRKKASREIRVTDPKSSQEIRMTRHVGECDEDAGQPVVSAEEGREGGSSGWEWPADSVGAEVNDEKLSA